ncbi:hypothetical protein, partial [Halopseudomonas yangmingensis]
MHQKDRYYSGLFYLKRLILLMHDTIKNPTYYALIAALIILYFVYSSGLGGTLYYDDFRPISGLGNIVDLNSKIAYVLGETSGPLGRPISMLTFLANQNDWPDNVHNILLFNIILHCINAVIVFFLCNLIIKLHDRKIRKTEIFALSASMLWMFSPLLISTSLIAVQRMAGLSALFVFLGLTLYLSCFKFQKINEKVRLVLQMLVIGTFTTLAMLSKENGILLPVFALVIELTILRENSLSKKYKQLRIISFSMCLSIIIAYLAHSTGNTEQSYMSRSFTMTERLFTQPVILFEYVRLAFIPDMFSYRPFHDNYQHFSSPYELKPLLAIIALFSLFLIAVIKIKKIPLFSFAVFWFISAHLLESTNLSLELYFEHRNYVALLGPCIAIAVFLQKIPERYKNLSITIFSL